MQKCDKRKIQWFLPGVLYLVFLLMHVFARPDFGDDVTYAELFRNRGLLDFLKDRYVGWSSRVVIEAVMLPLIVGSPWVWRILDALMASLLVWNVADLFGLPKEREKMQAQCIFFLLIWGVPLASLSSAGWITTTTNYLWPLTLGTIALRPLRNWLFGRKCTFWECALCPLCAVYASNMEQMGAVLAGVYLVLGIYLLWKKKKLPPFYFVMTALIVLSVCFILASPGNANRNMVEAERFFPGFLDLTSCEKIVMGFLESAHYYLAGGHRQVSYIFPMLTGTLFLALAGKPRKGKGHRALLQLFIALCPLAFFWIVGHLAKFLFYGGYLTRGLDAVWFVVGLFGENRQLPGLGNYGVWQVALQAVVYLCLLACVACTVYALHGKSGETLLQLLVLGAGFSSRVIVGFSPTLYASGDRTALYASAAILIVTLRNIQLYLRNGPGRAGRIILLLYLTFNISCNLIMAPK